MSALTFPAPAPPAGAFTWPIKRTFVMSTIVQTPASMRGVNTFQLMTYPLWQFELDYNYLKGDNNVDDSAIANLVGFALTVGGGADNWLYGDPYDYTVNSDEGVLFSLVTPGVIAEGDGTTTQFQLGRIIGNLESIEGPDIIQNAIDPVVVDNDESGGGYDVGPTGIVTFVDPPDEGDTFSWSGTFAYRCRFLDDQWDPLMANMPQQWELKGLKFISVIL